MNAINSTSMKVETPSSSRVSRKSSPTTATVIDSNGIEINAEPHGPLDEEVKASGKKIERGSRSRKEIIIGRWTLTEHEYFLEALEVFKTPAWGQIAKYIGTRTSTQVRTHAQKYFTKLARNGIMIPNFEEQIERERKRMNMSPNKSKKGTSSPTIKSSPQSVSISAGSEQSAYSQGVAPVYHANGANVAVGSIGGAAPPTYYQYAPMSSGHVSSQGGQPVYYASYSTPRGNVYGETYAVDSSHMGRMNELVAANELMQQQQQHHQQQQQQQQSQQQRQAPLQQLSHQGRSEYSFPSQQQQISPVARGSGLYGAMRNHTVASSNLPAAKSLELKAQSLPPLRDYLNRALC